jgi:outer membrane protein assembly factor BamB
MASANWTFAVLLALAAMVQSSPQSSALGRWFYVCSPEEGLQAFVDGTAQWNRTLTGEECVSLISFNRTVIISLSSGWVSGLHFETGQQLWAQSLNATISHAVLSPLPGVVLVWGVLGMASALDIQTGKWVWCDQSLPQLTNIAPADGLTLVTSALHVSAWSLWNSADVRKQLWSTPLASPISAVLPHVQDGLVYVLCHDTAVPGLSIAVLDLGMSVPTYHTHL